MVFPYYPNSITPFPDAGSGIITGYDIQPYHVSDVYLELSGITRVIGINPLNGYSSITARITGIENILITGVSTPLSFGINSISISRANSLIDGYLTSSDWNIFNNKQTSLGFVPLNSVISGNITLLSGSLLLNSVSGINNLGSIANPFNNIYTNQINGKVSLISQINEVPIGQINSTNNIFLLSNVPYPNTLTIYNNGLRMTPSGLYASANDYTLSGVNIIFKVPPTSGSILLVDYGYTL